MRFSNALVALLLIAGASACVRVQARTPAAPPLAAPPPPERVIIPAPIPEEAPEPVAPPAPAPRPPDANPARPPQRASQPAPPPAPPPAATSEPAPVRLLQSTANPAEVERQTLLQLAAAKRDLDRAILRPLSANARVQYDTARGFIRQAEEALKAKNQALARELADKAVALATQLAR